MPGRKHKVQLTIPRLWDDSYRDIPEVYPKWFATSFEALEGVEQGHIFRVLDDDGILTKGTYLRLYFMGSLPSKGKKSKERETIKNASFRIYLASTDACIFGIELRETTAMVEFKPKVDMTCLVSGRPFSLDALYATCPSFCCPQAEAPTKLVLANLEFVK